MMLNLNLGKSKILIIIMFHMCYVNRNLWTVKDLKKLWRVDEIIYLKYWTLIDWLIKDCWLIG